MTDLGVVVGAGTAGLLVVGPLVVHAVLAWLGWRVALPLVLLRVPAAGEVGRPGGRCRGCGRPLGPVGLPAVSARTTCRRCGSPMALWYLAIDLACAAVAAIVAAAVGWSAALVPLLGLATGLVAVAATDLLVMRIPTRFVWTTLGALVAGAGYVAVVDGPGRRLFGLAVGAAVVGGFLLVLHVISPRSLGFGDVRLGTLVGAAVGWSAWGDDDPVLRSVQGGLNALLLAGLIGALAGGVLLVIRRRDRPFPFGPALATAGLVVSLATVGG